MSKVQDSTVLRKNIKTYLKGCGYTDEFIGSLEHHCWNLNCRSYDKYKKDNNISEMTYGDLIKFVEEKYMRGYYRCDAAHIASAKHCKIDGYTDFMNEYLNGIILCKNCHDYYDNWNGGAGSNTKRARTNEDSMTGRQIVLNILEMKQKSMIFFKIKGNSK